MSVAFVFLFLSSFLRADAVQPLSDLASDAETSFAAGDFYKAYRSFGVIEQVKPASFGRTGVGGYLESLFIVGPEKIFIQECDRLIQSKDNLTKAKTAYICGLHLTEMKKPEIALKYLSQLDQKTKFFWPGQIVLASIDLMLNRPEQATILLKYTEIKKYTETGLENQFYITRARALALQNRFEEAMRDYQSIPSGSSFYVEALGETAWVLFKQERLESAQVLLDVMKTNYETSKRLGEGFEVSPTDYFRARYFEAYLALIQKRTDLATTLFSALKSDYAAFLDTSKSLMETKGTLSMIHDQNMKWPDTKSYPGEVRDQLQLIGYWLGAEHQKQYENEVLFEMAITREISRFETYKKDLGPGFQSYGVELLRLEKKNWLEFSKKFPESLKKTSHNLATLALKAELGRLEIVWMGRAQGIRDLEEVIDDYRREVHTLDEFAGQ